MVIFNVVFCCMCTYLDHFEQLFNFDFFQSNQRVFDKFSLIALACCENDVQILDGDLEWLRLELAPWNVYLQLLDITLYYSERHTYNLLGQLFHRVFFYLNKCFQIPII